MIICGLGGFKGGSAALGGKIPCWWRRELAWPLEMLWLRAQRRASIAQDVGSRSPGAWALVPCGVVETTMGGAHMEGEHIPTSWVGRRVRLITVVTADRTSQEEGILLNLDQLGITIRRPLLAGSDEQEVVFHPWVHVYQLGPLIRE